MNPTACSQTGCSGLAPAPELCPYGAPAAATSPCRAFMNKPQPFFSTLTLISFLLNLTHTSFYWHQTGGEKQPLAPCICIKHDEALEYGNITSKNDRNCRDAVRWGEGSQIAP